MQAQAVSLSVVTRTKQTKRLVKVSSLLIFIACTS
jgi:hypothetical protein